MSKRFKVLRGALRYLRTSETDADVTLPIGTPLRKFQDWDNNKVKVTYVRRAESKPIAIIEVAVNSFGKLYNADNKVIVPMSKRASDESRISSFVTAGNVDKTIADTDEKIKGFVPAKCTVSIPNATLNKNNNPSKFTGIEYDLKGRESFTFPIGRGSATDYYDKVKGDITAALPAGSLINLQFSSEKTK